MSETETATKRPRINYWLLWLLNAVLASAGVLFFLAAQYGTFEYFGMACLMALLPFIPVMVLVGGAGSTLFALTKVMIEKRGIRRPAALSLLMGPGLALAVLLGFLGLNQAQNRRLDYICLGHAPASASHVRIAGYSGFLRGEWLAVFNVGQKDFQTMVAKVELTPVDEFVFREALEKSSVKTTSPGQAFAPLTNAIYFRRAFDEKNEHKRGGVYAAFDPATSTAVLYREYHD